MGRHYCFTNDAFVVLSCLCSSCPRVPLFHRRKSDRKKFTARLAAEATAEGTNVAVVGAVRVFFGASRWCLERVLEGSVAGGKYLP